MQLWKIFNDKKYSQINKWQNYNFILKNKESLIQNLKAQIEDSYFNETGSRIEAERIVNSSMFVAKSYSIQFLSLFNKCKSKIEDYLTVVGSIPISETQIFADALCGHSKHTSSSELYFSSYEPLLENINTNKDIKALFTEFRKNSSNNMKNNQSWDEVLQHFLDSNKKRINKLSQTIIINKENKAENIFSFISENKKGVKFWDCNDVLCKQKYDVYIVNELYSMLKKFHECTVHNIANYLYEIFEGCSEKVNDKMGHLSSCYSKPRSCKSKILPLFIMSTHYPNMRTLKSHFYKMKFLCTSIFAIDDALQNSDYFYLKTIVAEAEEVTTLYPVQDTQKFLTEKYLNEQYSKAIKAYTAVASDLPRHACFSCEKLCCLKDVKNLEKYEDIKTLLYLEKNIRN